MGNKTPQLAPDPSLQAEGQKAQNDLVSSLQTETQGDMASLMARYGMHLAMAGANYGPLNSPSVSTTTGGMSRAA